MLISIFIVTLVATICYGKYKHLPIRYILHLSWIASITEITARIIAEKTGNNHAIYNLYLLLLLFILYTMIYNHIQKPRLKKTALRIGITVGLVIIARTFYIPVLSQFMTYMHALGMIILVILLLIYAVDLLSSNQRIIIKERLELFVFSGYLLFGISFIPLSLFMFNQEMYEQLPSAYTIFEAIQTGLLLLMNLIICIGLLWTRPLKLSEKK